MKRLIILFLVTLMMSCGDIKSQGHQDVSDGYIIEYNLDSRTNPILEKAFNDYIEELNRYGVSIPSKLINIKLLMTEEDLGKNIGITEGGFSHSSLGDVIIFSNSVTSDEKILKRVMFKILTQRLDLGLTAANSKIMSDEVGDFTQKDYDELIALIVIGWKKQGWSQKNLTVDLVGRI